jgi:hypothetical protein
MTQFNLDLANRVMHQITLHPERHVQSSGDHCVVGWAVRLANSDDMQVFRDYSGQTERDRFNEARWRTGTREVAALMLGAPEHVVSDIWTDMYNRSAKHKLQVLINTEVKRRRHDAKAQQKLDRAQAKQDKKIAKRHARIEEETQRSMDLQAREQVHAFRRKTKAQKVMEQLFSSEPL